MKLEELRDLSADELVAKLGEGKTELFNLRFQQATGQLDNPLKIREARRNIARVHTIMREKELLAAKPEAAKPEAAKTQAAKTQAAAEVTGEGVA